MASSRDVVTAWRIVTTPYAPTAFDGEGARITGGRWNSPGRRAIYTADSIALAALELLVHLQNSAVLSQYVMIACRFPRRLVTAVDPGTLPANWNASPAPAAVRRIGDEWLANGTTPVLSVPSAVIDAERNYVLNPQHPDFASLAIEPPRAFAFDIRLAR
jgi:RES domain-containing protein